MVQVDADRCCYCGCCVGVCPGDALHLAETRLIVRDNCVECGLCAVACPLGAISEPESPTPQWTEGRIGPRYDLAVVGAGPAGATARS